ncbi:MAG: CPBP family intramembrane metalloprotease [Cyanosarcina radialis HA8281-LM2]|jgi:hypothetical protein|nr:CPBP family intramembrane metalloprotease [Cyanosarcina radialis HA8281-LM2]
MTIKRIFLVLLTIFIVFKISLSLIVSLDRPQIQSRLELYQTNLLLRATELQVEAKDNKDGTNLQAVREAFLGKEPLELATKQYIEAQQSLQNNLDKIATKSQNITKETDSGKIKELIQTGNRSLAELNLRIGLLQVEQGQKQTGLQTWKNLIDRSPGKASEISSFQKTAEILINLWSPTAKLPSDSELQIQKDLDGWFRDRALSQLYRSQQRQDDLAALNARIQELAQQAIFKLLLIGSLPVIGLIIGVGLLIFLFGQFFVQRERSLIARNGNIPWNTPWNAETTWQVLAVGFFAVKDIFLPLILGVSLAILKVNIASLSYQMQAVFNLIAYILVAALSILVLYLSLKPFLPLPKEWFRWNVNFSGFLWGASGYFAALPLVLIVSLINQKLWQGYGGSNPLLPVVLEGQNWVTLALLFITASVAAPIFEELMFRGFMLPSLTRYLPVWGAIAVSSLLFAIAHLSLSEVLPLTTLGIILGVVYTRSRNLFSSIVLHSLWNSGTLLSLFILGSGSN